MKKKLIAFDLDGTIAKSKSEVSTTMISALANLSTKYEIVIISGGDFSQFKKQFLNKIPKNLNHLKSHLHMLPTNGTKYFKYSEGKLKKIFSEDFPKNRAREIFAAAEQVLSEFQFDKIQTWGKQIENRGTQVTVSVLGQNAPLDQKEKWDPDSQIRLKMSKKLKKLLPDFEIRTAGATSIDITKKGIDKGYAITKIQAILNLKDQDILFIGDALHKGGNDYAVKQAGIESIKTQGPEQTLTIINEILGIAN